MSGEAVKLLDRLAPNLVHVCGFVWEWTYIITIRPSIPQEAFRGVFGGHKFKSGTAAKRMDRLAPNSVTSVGSSENGHRLKTIRPTIPHGGILGRFTGSTIQKPEKCGQTAGPIGNQFCMYNAGESGNGHRLNILAHETPGRAF